MLAQQLDQVQKAWVQYLVAALARFSLVQAHTVSQLMACGLTLCYIKADVQECVPCRRPQVCLKSHLVA